MSANIIDGKAFAARVRQKVASKVADLKETHSITPGLAVVLVGEDPASQVYVRSKGKQTIEVGMNSFERKLDVNTPEEVLLALIDELNADPIVHGILVQLPLPKHVDESLVTNRIVPEKDVDGFHIANVGLLGTGQQSMVPCTPLGCLLMLRDYHGSLSGKNAVVIGRSNIVGKPMAQRPRAGQHPATQPNGHSLYSSCHSNFLRGSVGICRNHPKLGNEAPSGSLY